MRKKLIIANWKMNLTVAQSSLFVHRLSERVELHKDVEVVLAPSALCLQPLSLDIDHRKFKLAAQNAFYKDEGAYTGEVSFAMLRGLVHYALVGHSERRHNFGENLETVQLKMGACVRNGIIPVLCVGETKRERIDKETSQIIHDQLMTALADLTDDEVSEIVVAYEPVWALSNGCDFLGHETPTSQDIKKVTQAIRNDIEKVYGEAAANSVRVLYGGSVNAASVHELMNSAGVDGLLVGGASLNYAEFANIANAVSEHAAKEAKSE